jgi:hypothetical protein
MYERETDAASIDELAARINADAARVAALVDERERSARQLQSLARYSVIENAAPEEPTDAGRAARDVQIAAAMAEQVTVIRSAAGELQRLASELRATVVNRV